jgi:hypothetical protein
MAWFRGLLDTQKLLRRQQQRIATLEEENAALRAQNQSMREGMRRCVTCDYRIDFKNRQGQAPVETSPAE